jgi:hypothetical protein
MHTKYLDLVERLVPGSDVEGIFAAAIAYLSEESKVDKVNKITSWREYIQLLIY